MKFLGTGAGEGIPNPFCTCKVCENARRVKGREIRTRSSFMLDKKNIIDIGADFFAQSFLYNESFAQIENVLFTHMHEDHINFSLFWERKVRLSNEGHILNAYFTDDAINYINDFYKSSPITSGCTDCLKPDNAGIIVLNCNKTYKIGDYSVTPVKANHSTNFEKNGSNYLIEKNGKKMFYGLDSGYFTDDAFNLLKNQKLDILITECTAPALNEYPDDHCHMDITLCLKNLDKLYSINAITHDTQIYLSHIAPINMTHAELTQYMNSLDKPYRVSVAYDGLDIGTL